MVTIDEPISHTPNQYECFKEFFGCWEGEDLEDMVDLVYHTRGKF